MKIWIIKDSSVAKEIYSEIIALLFPIIGSKKSRIYFEFVEANRNYVDDMSHNEAFEICEKYKSQYGLKQRDCVVLFTNELIRGQLSNSNIDNNIVICVNGWNQYNNGSNVPILYLLIEELKHISQFKTHSNWDINFSEYKLWAAKNLFSDVKDAISQFISKFPSDAEESLKYIKKQRAEVKNDNTLSIRQKSKVLSTLKYLENLVLRTNLKSKPLFNENEFLSITISSNCDLTFSFTKDRSILISLNAKEKLIYTYFLLWCSFEGSKVTEFPTEALEVYQKLYSDISRHYHTHIEKITPRFFRYISQNRHNIKSKIESSLNCTLGDMEIGYKNSMFLISQKAGIYKLPIPKNQIVIENHKRLLDCISELNRTFIKVIKTKVL